MKTIEEYNNELEEENKTLYEDKNYWKRLAEKRKYQLQQKENIIKEVRQYIMSNLITEWDIKHGGYVSGSDLPVDAITPILEILGGENNDK